LELWGENFVVEEIMTVKEVAKYLKTGISTIYKLAQEGNYVVPRQVTSGGLGRTKLMNHWIKRMRKKDIDCYAFDY